MSSCAHFLVSYTIIFAPTRPFLVTYSLSFSLEILTLYTLLKQTRGLKIQKAVYYVFLLFLLSTRFCLSSTFYMFLLDKVNSQYLWVPLEHIVKALLHRGLFLAER